MNSISSLGQKAKEAEVVMRSMSTDQKNKALRVIADALLFHSDEILKANQTDLENAVAAGMSPGMQDRLRLTKERLDDIAEGMRQVAARTGVSSSWSSRGRADACASQSMARSCSTCQIGVARLDRWRCVRGAARCACTILR